MVVELILGWAFRLSNGKSNSYSKCMMTGIPSKVVPFGRRVVISVKYCVA